MISEGELSADSRRLLDRDTVCVCSNAFPSFVHAGAPIRVFECFLWVCLHWMFPLNVFLLWMLLFPSKVSLSLSRLKVASECLASCLRNTVVFWRSSRECRSECEYRLPIPTAIASAIPNCPCRKIESIATSDTPLSSDGRAITLDGRLKIESAQICLSSGTHTGKQYRRDCRKIEKIRKIEKFRKIKYTSANLLN